MNVHVVELVIKDLKPNLSSLCHLGLYSIVEFILNQMNFDIKDRIIGIGRCCVN